MANKAATIHSGSPKRPSQFKRYFKMYFKLFALTNVGLLMYYALIM